MTIIAVMLGLAFVVCAYVGLIHRDRAANLDILLRHARAEQVDLLYQLDDATRELERLRHTNGALLAENSTLLVDLMHTEERNVYLESLHTQRKGEMAGVLLTDYVINPKSKMSVWRGGA